MKPVYTVRLEREVDHVANNLTINVEDMWGATMDHDLTSKNAPEKSDARFDGFYSHSIITVLRRHLLLPRVFI
jgi:hypothetical protein